MKILKTLLILFVISIQSVPAQIAEDSAIALLIVDIQDFYFPGEAMELTGAEKASEVAKEVLNIFRAKELEIVHVRHQAKSGFEIHKNVAPIEGEKIITKQEVNCFNGTDLLTFLKDKKISHLVIVGMQTHMCLEGAVRAAYDFGFRCYVIEDACATRDVKYGDAIVKAADVHASTLSTISQAGYASVMSFSEFESRKDEILF